MGFSLRLQRFCCCCTVRTGTLVIGTVGWLCTLIQIIVIPNSTDSQSALTTRICACMVSLLISILLIVGVNKQNNKLMLPWLVLQCLGCIAVTIGFFMGFIAMCHIQTGLIVGLTILLFLMCLLNWYCWICVWSHYMELNEREATISADVQYSPTQDNPPPDTKAGAPLF